MSPAQEALLLKIEAEPPRTMTATALNTASPIVPGAAGATGPTAPGAGGKAAQAGNPLAGFEALLAALFPQADPATTAAVAAQGAGGKAGAKVATADPLAPDADKDGKAAGKDDAAAAGEPADAAATATAGDPNTALAACLTAVPAPVTEAALVKVAADTGSAAATPYVLRAALPVALATGAPAKGELTAEADAAETTAEPQVLAAAAKPTLPDTAKAETKPAPPAWGRDKPAGQPAAPALANAAAKAAPTETADPAAAEASAPQATPAVTDAAASAVATATLAGPAPAPGPAPKPAKVERPKAGRDIETLSEVKAPQAADKPVTARAVTATAKPAGPGAETVDAAATGPGKAAPDAPEAAVAGETHAAATQSTAPLAHAAHEVRGAPETVANLAAQVVKKLEAKSTRFDVELNPAGLGKVNVRVEIGAQGAITAAMSFDNPQAAAELRSRATELQRALEQAGFTLSGAMTFDVAQDRGQQGGPWQQAQQDGGDSGRAFRGQAFQSALDTAGDAASAAVNGALRLRRGVTAGVDVRI